MSDHTPGPCMFCGKGPNTNDLIAAAPERHEALSKAAAALGVLSNHLEGDLRGFALEAFKAARAAIVVESSL